MKKNLMQYLEHDIERGVIDHALRAQHDADGNVRFYIHPQGKDGDTLDFQVEGNKLIAIVDGIVDGVAATACQGKNCGTTEAKHSAECLEEASLAQGWANFGTALRALKDGKKVSRIGWIQKGAWLSMSGGADGHFVSADKFWSPHNAAYAATCPDGVAHVLPCITMKTADGSILMGWSPSQPDMLTEDWICVGNS